MEWYADSKGLIPETEWRKQIDELEALSKPSTKEDVKKAVINAIQSRIPKQKFGVFLSGGVDSSFIALICKHAKADFICYGIGMEGAPDLQWAEKVAKELKLTLRTRSFTLQEVAPYFEKAASILKTPDVLGVGIGALVIAAVELAKKDGITVLIGGLGSEEIFAGYNRHLVSDNVHEECWRGMKEVMYHRDLERDCALAKAAGVSVMTPFLDKDLIRIAMGIPSEKKINEKQKKIILREIAEELGLPKDVAWRDKKAAQYGSWFDKALKKISKQNNIYKQDFVKQLIPS